jgi:hypothetical protein
MPKTYSSHFVYQGSVLIPETLRKVKNIIIKNAGFCKLKIKAEIFLSDEIGNSCFWPLPFFGTLFSRPLERTFHRFRTAKRTTTTSTTTTTVTTTTPHHNLNKSSSTSALIKSHQDS